MPQHALGGVLYTFVGTSLQSLPSFAAFYREQQEPQVILRPLRHRTHSRADAVEPRPRGATQLADSDVRRSQLRHMKM